jgi:hypothetical protein
MSRIAKQIVGEAAERIPYWEREEKQQHIANLKGNRI